VHLVNIFKYSDVRYGEINENHREKSYSLSTIPAVTRDENTSKLPNLYINFDTTVYPIYRSFEIATLKSD